MARTLLNLAPLMVLTLTACGSGPSDSCPSAGTYVPTPTRSADPGDCPLDVDVLTFDPVVLGQKKNCHPETGTFGYDLDNGVYTCSVEGTLEIVPSESEIQATYKVRTDCWGDYSSACCTANYDVVYTLEGAP